ncbi:hypothetical protein [Exiguobacterium sp. s193]|uniref:hypothetical protein n=1 Tax=Exiguobacterium sp. s193 TaxID=2751207 RepID=UPI001BEA900F|nr:hypothetical protein [Exiguobacterium sp. s193]
MYRRYFLFLIWIVAIVFILAFGNNRIFPDGFLFSFLRFDQSQFDTSALSLFTLLGIYPLAFFLLFLDEKRFLKPSPMLASLGAFVLGSFVLMPYLALAIPRQTFLPFRRRSWVLVVVPILAFLSACIIWIALARSDWSIFALYFMTNQFVRTMSVDIVMFYILQLFMFFRIRSRTETRPGWRDFIPLFGLFSYLFRRHVSGSS